MANWLSIRLTLPHIWSSDNWNGSQVVVATKQDVDRIDLPYEEIEATVSFFFNNIFSLVSQCFRRCGLLNVLIKAKSGHHLFTFLDNWALTIIYCGFGFPWKCTGGTRPAVRSVSTPCWNQVSLDWECGYVECSSLEGTGVAAVFKWDKLITTLPLISPSSPRRLNFSPLSSLLYLSPFHPCRELQTQALLRGATTPVWRKKRTSSSSSRSSASSLLNRLLSREDSRGKLKETCKIS